MPPCRVDERRISKYVVPVRSGLAGYRGEWCGCTSCAHDPAPIEHVPVDQVCPILAACIRQLVLEEERAHACPVPHRGCLSQAHEAVVVVRVHASEVTRAERQASLGGGGIVRWNAGDETGVACVWLAATACNLVGSKGDTVGMTRLRLVSTCVQYRCGHLIGWEVCELTRLEER